MKAAWFAIWFAVAYVLTCWLYSASRVATFWRAAK
jgi:uncharacterized membrane protein